MKKERRTPRAIEICRKLFKKDPATLKNPDKRRTYAMGRYHTIISYFLVIFGTGIIIIITIVIGIVIGIVITTNCVPPKPPRRWRTQRPTLCTG
jgi:hypothetical protein